MGSLAMPQNFSPNDVEGWSDANKRIRQIVQSLCHERPRNERNAIAANLVDLVRVTARGDSPGDSFEARVWRHGLARTLWHDRSEWIGLVFAQLVVIILFLGVCLLYRLV